MKADYTSKEITTRNMLDYLSQFKSIQEKYRVFPDRDLMQQLKQMEEIWRLGKLQKNPPSYIGKTVKSVYNLPAGSQMDSMVMFDKVKNDIIHDYLGIPGLGMLFNEHFYDLEWDMHLEYDFKKSKSYYYRDHVEHQIRNMYMMLQLLDHYDFMNVIQRRIISSNNGYQIDLESNKDKISKYIWVHLNSFINNQVLNHEQENALRKCSKTFMFNQYHKTAQIFFNQIKNKSELPTGRELIDDFSRCVLKQTRMDIRDKIEETIKGFVGIKNLDKEVDLTKLDYIKQRLIKVFKSLWNMPKYADIFFRLYREHYCLDYIIRSSAIISALFHDISYPLTYFHKVRNRIGEYLPAMNAFINNSAADIDRIVTILKPSLLFTVVDEREIREMLSFDSEKWDHGVYSAIALLLTFYESGRIHRLSIDKQTAIEVAAVAIYNHNFDYALIKISSGKPPEEERYYRPVFTLNPISYLLKISDDLQEWDRKYFELSEQDECIFCPRCLMPILHYTPQIENKSIYTCMCDNGNHHRLSYFPNRNMYIVTVCDKLLLTTKKYTKNQKNNLIIHLDYDYLKLLNMAKISTSYSLYRSKELRNLKIYLQNQKFSDDAAILQINSIYLDYIMTCNPLLLKSLLLLDVVLPKFSSKVTIRKLNDNDLDKYRNMLDACLSVVIHAHTDFSIIDYAEKLFHGFEKDINMPIKQKTDLNKHPIFNRLRKCFAFLSTAEEARRNAINYIQTYGVGLNEKKMYLERINTLFDELFLKWNKYIKESFFPVFIFLITRNRKWKTDKTAKKEYIDRIEHKIYFYLEVALFIAASNLGVILPPKDLMLTCFQNTPRLFDSNIIDFKNIICFLVEDICDIIYNPVDIYHDNNPDENDYLNSYYSKSKQITFVVDKYCNPINWYGKISGNSISNYKQFSENNLDFYSDLFLFEVIGRKENDDI